MTPSAPPPPRPSLRVACRYRFDCGYSVIPVLRDGSKKPAVSWKVYQSEPAAESELIEWFGGGAQYGYALVHGCISGNSEVLDFDVIGAFEEFAQLCADHGFGDLLDSCVQVSTPTGGKHVYYRCAEPVEGNLKLAQRAVTVDPDGRTDVDMRKFGAKPYPAGPLLGQWFKTETKIETRGEGGYTIAPGSPMDCHPSHKEYIKTHGGFDKTPFVTAEQRTALLSMARACNEFTEEIHVPVSAPPKSVYIPDSEDVSPGDDFNERGDSLPLLLEAGWQVSHRRGDVVELTRPGKGPRDGVSGTLHAVAVNVFYCFTSSDSMFEMNHGYKPFSVYGLVKCGGDFAEAARQLATQGYGTQREPATRHERAYTAGPNKPPISAALPLPNDTEAERAVLASMLCSGEDGRAIEDAADTVTQGDFYDPAHGEVFRAICALWKVRQPIDAITLRNELCRLKMGCDIVERAGGEDWLRALFEIAPVSAAAARAHAQIVAAKATFRRIHMAAREIAGNALSETDTARAEAFATDASKRLADCIPNSKRSSWTTGGVEAAHASARSDERARGGTNLAGISTGLVRLDRITNGLEPATLWTLAGRTSMGKTACAVSIARNVAKQNIGVAFISAEMPKEIIGDRLLANEARVNLKDIKRGSYTPEDRAEMREAELRLLPLPFYIEDKARSVQEIETRVNWLNRNMYEIGLVVVDYLQYLEPSARLRNGTEYDRVSEIVHDLREVGRKFNVPVIALAQLSRAVERREIKEPMLSDLNASGKIEAESDVVIMLYRPSYYERKGDEEMLKPGEIDEVKMIAAKNRNGETGFVTAGFLPHYCRFDNYVEGVF